MSDNTDETVVTPPLPFPYRQATAKYVAELGNQILSRAFEWYQGHMEDATFELVLLNCQIEFTRLLQVVHNERIINSMQQDVLSGANQILADNNNRLTPPTPPAVPEPPGPTGPIPTWLSPPLEEERREDNGPTAPDPD